MTTHPPATVETVKRGDVFDASCPARHLLDLIAGKWPILIISALEGGPMRNGALLRRIGGISQKMLTQTLRELERNGLIERIAHAVVPPHVEYRLSPYGETLSAALIPLDRWAEENVPVLDALRTARDTATRDDG